MRFVNSIVKMKLKIVVLCCISLIVFVKSLATGDSCIVLKTRRPGICKGYLDCKAVLAELPNSIPTICDRSLMTVCCPTSHQKVYPLVKEERISDQKCQEYGKFYTKTEEIINSLNGKLNKTVCTCSSVIALVIDGTEAKEKEFPHMALIGFGLEESIIYGCGGSLISDQWVLTAGHCSITLAGPPTFVKLGTIQRHENDESKFKIYSVIKVVSHPEYEKGKVLNDIALLKLDRVVVFTDYIVPICLPTSRNVHIFAIATGWGENGVVRKAENLMKVKLEIFPRDECTKNYPNVRSLPDGIVDDLMICAGHRFEPKDTCRGDSGGPLQVYRKDMPCMFTLIGSTSFGNRECGTIGIPAVYARTYNFLDWIERTVWPESFTNI